MDEEVIRAAEILYSFSNPATENDRRKTESYIRGEILKRAHNVVPSRSAEEEEDEDDQVQGDDRNFDNDEEDEDHLDQESETPGLNFQEIRMYINDSAAEKTVSSTKKLLTQIDCLGDCFQLENNFVLKKIVPLLRNEENLQQGISVEVIDSKLEKYNMVLRSFGDGLITNLHSWKNLRQVNDFKQETEVEVSVYRNARSRKLAFAIYKIPE